MPHPPARGHYWLASCPLVHTGFWRTYKATRAGMLGLLREITGGGDEEEGQAAGPGWPGGGSSGSSGHGKALEGRGSQGGGGQPWKLYFTGHR